MCYLLGADVRPSMVRPNRIFKRDLSDCKITDPGKTERPTAVSTKVP